MTSPTTLLQSEMKKIEKEFDSVWENCATTGDESQQDLVKSFYRQSIFSLATKLVESFEEERWLPIKEYEGLYEVSSWGRVKSLERKTMGRWSKNKTSHGVILNQEIMDNNYLRVDLSTGNITKHFLVHRLVADAFIPNEKNHPCVNHLDCNRTNNHVENLEWCTHKENTQHGLSFNGKIGKRKEKTLTIEQVYSILGEDEGAWEKDGESWEQVAGWADRNTLRASQRSRLAEVLEKIKEVKGVKK